QLTLELSRGPDRFQAVFDLDRQVCTLVRLAKDKEPQTLKEAPVKVPASRARLRFANVDERLTVWVDERLVFGDGVEYDGPRGFGPVKENDLDRPAGVGVKGAAVTLRRLRLYRDAYYAQGRRGRDAWEFDP